LIKTYKVKEIMFYDDLMPQKYVRELCEEIIERKVSIYWEVPQRVNLVDPELLKLMYRAGCRMLRYGVEQGDPEMMQLVEKKTTIDQVRRVFEWTHDAGIDTLAYFIIGYIGENERTMRATIELAKELNPRYVMFTKATPLPATPLMESAIRGGFIDRNYWSDFVLGKRPEPIQPFVPDVAVWVKKAYREFYLRPSRVFKQIGYIRSWLEFRKSFSAFSGLLFFRMTDV
jgi:anaerobic magnesium-protoporphyrin IX monomethyl ester cyclase